MKNELTYKWIYWKGEKIKKVFTSKQNKLERKQRKYILTLQKTHTLKQNLCSTENS